LERNIEASLSYLSNHAIQQNYSNPLATDSVFLTRNG